MVISRLLCKFAVAAALLLACAACGGNPALPNHDIGDPQAKVQSSYDPLAPSVHMPSLAEALATAPAMQAGPFSVTALTDRNVPDQSALNALVLTESAGELTVSVDEAVDNLALYVSYDPASHHVGSMDAGYPGGIGYALEYAPGMLAVGVTGVNGRTVPAGKPLATITLERGESTAVLRSASISQDPRSAVDDLEAVDNTDGSATLGWSERHTGDYDNNGEVNISDITPVGLNFSKVFTDLSPDFAKLDLVDGDRNFEINISDLTPIGLNFNSVIKGYNVYRTELNDPEEVPDPSEGGRWTKVENDTDPSGPSILRDFNGQNFRLRYSFMDDSGNGDFGWYVAAVGVDGDVPPEGPDSNVTTLSVGGGGAPPALLVFEIVAPDGSLMNVDNEFYLTVKVEGVEGLFSANVRFEYDSDLVEYIEGVPAYDTHVNFLTPPLFVDADDVGGAPSPYRLLGFNATQTQGEPGKDGDGSLGYFKFRAVGTGINSEAFRFPQTTTYIYLWGDQYGVPTATPSLGPGQLLNIGL